MGIAAGRCCQQDNVAIPRGCVPELALPPENGGEKRQDLGDMLSSREHRCWRGEDGVDLETVPTRVDSLESLSYSPVRFDVPTTIDVERSQARYSNIVVQRSHARLQRRSKVWEDWLHAATAGRSITLLTGFPDETPRKSPDGEESNTMRACKRIEGKYFLDRALTRISILPLETQCEEAAALAGTILVDNIQVICTATDFMMFAEQIQSQLHESERSRAVLLQWVKEDNKAQKRRICFLEASPQDKDRFVQALTALWLEKRNDHSMWF